MTEKDQHELAPPYGNLSILEIKEYPGQGLIIKWMGNTYMDTMIDSEGLEADMYNWVKQKYPNIKDAAGGRLAVDSNEMGLLKQIGDVNGEPVKLRPSEYKED